MKHNIFNQQLNNKMKTGIKFLINTALAVALIGFAPTLLADDKADAKAELLQPDPGCYLEFTSKGFRIFSPSTATYKHNNSRDILTAKRKALLKAKVQLAKFLRGTVITDEFVIAALAAEGLGVTREECMRRTKVMRIDANAIINGFLVISTQIDRNTNTVSCVGVVGDKTRIPISIIKCEPRPNLLRRHIISCNRAGDF